MRGGGSVCGEGDGSVCDDGNVHGEGNGSVCGDGVCVVKVMVVCVVMQQSVCKATEHPRQPAPTAILAPGFELVNLELATPLLDLDNEGGVVVVQVEWWRRRWWR